MELLRLPGGSNSGGNHKPDDSTKPHPRTGPQARRRKGRPKRKRLLLRRRLRAEEEGGVLSRPITVGVLL